MQAIILASLLSLQAIPATAGDFPFTKMVNVSKLETDLRAANFDVVDTRCSGDKCVLRLGAAETKDPSAIIAAHVYVDPLASKDTARTQAIAIAKKLKAGTASAAEKDALLLRLCFILLSTDQ